MLSLALKFLLISIFFNNAARALENGLARTPPMGWMHWLRFGCSTDCGKFPNECVSEKLFKRTTDVLVNEGYLDAGYEYVIVDDCWMEPARDSVTQKLVENRLNFPKGLNDLADYIHNKGAKFGLYQNYGNYTCAGFPGIINHMDLDAQSFADWDVDYVKLDGCYVNVNKMDEGYPEFGRLLNRTGRPMVYSCSWPVYQESEGKLVFSANYEALKKYCNLWRNGNDIADSFKSVQEIMFYFAYHQDRFQPNAGPGHWNDPDMLILGNKGLSYDQSKLQMAVWSIMAAPLIMSNDLATVRPEMKEILQNKYIIAVDQDPLGIQGRLILPGNKIEIWSRPITPVVGHNQYSYAVAFVSRQTVGPAYSSQLKLSDLNLNHKHGYLVTDLYKSNKPVGNYGPEDFFRTSVPPNGVTFYKFTALN